MGKWIRGIAICITCMCLLWGGTWIADLVQIKENVSQYSGIENPDEADFAQVKQKICEIADEYGKKVREVMVDGLILLDHAIDYLLEQVDVDPNQENILSAG